MKSFRRLEGIVRGFSNHRRIQILEHLAAHPEASVEAVAGALRSNFKTISSHLKRLAVAGLVSRRAKGLSVCHRLTDRGRSVLELLKSLDGM